MCNWVLNLLLSGGCFGFADTLCDIIIGENHEVDSKKKIDYEQINNTSTAVQEKQPKVIEELSALQTIFVCVAFTYAVLVFYFGWILWVHQDYLTLLGGKSFLFQEKYDYKFYYALASGVFCYLHYHFTICAFETSASTVILPLLQFPSIVTFVLSSIHKASLGMVWLESYWHILAYLFLFIGGLLPATDGNLSTLASKQFWKQPFVKSAIIAELCHGAYNMCISTVEDEIKTTYQFMEYFALTRVLFVGAFVFYMICSKKVQEECWKLQYVVKKQINTTLIVEALTIFGYFNSAMAYQCYYNTGVVTAAESALNQMMNLFFAVLLKKVFNLGREASNTGICTKIFAAFMIFIGLMMAGGGH